MDSSLRQWVIDTDKCNPRLTQNKFFSVHFVLIFHVDKSILTIVEKQATGFKKII